MEKKILSLPIIAYLMQNTYAVAVVRESSQEAMNSGASNTFLTIIVMLVIAVFVIMLAFWVIFKTYKAFTDFNRKKKDFLYETFEKDQKQCYISRDTSMMKRNWKLFWLFWKRNHVYADTEDGLKIIGSYNGETNKKENFYLIALHNKAGLFKNAYKVILVPTSIKKKLVKKIEIDGKSVIVLDCEGVDNIGNTDYYYIPLIKQKEDKFIDFADKIQNDYIEKIVLRDLVKTNLMQYREGTIKAVESNPNVHFKRRTE